VSARKKPKMGRPPLPKGMVRQTFTIRITPADREAFERAAKTAGKPVTQWARDVLIERASG
jgi:hypothetical protein